MTEGPLVAVLDYGIGNLRSAQKALQRMGARATLTADRGLIGEAAGIVLPGVGAFGRCLEALDESGLTGIAREAAVDAATGGRPFLGICVGMQMLFDGSDESSGSPGLGVIEGRVRRITGEVKCPQMQWNRLDITDDEALFAGLPPGAWMYFVHGYTAQVGPATVATCEYGTPLCAAVRRGNLWGVQFHPEKSGRTGLKVLGNFVDSLPGGP
ncbi:MAG TPA: imidazole glycerol phosphate synthase subunit HisH [Acidimicrobiales bacterium]|nr:imidazole glycerol phosphate synthase subunit HisH [Actinomycetota bacterium]MDP6061663.1 imidazole glycerol phosphate synthase subunit HisH [Acidimicrobiales bacterium]MDP7210007.1 imidazole glycerol phosphate synthase subunit HisH [Acidimicrobiales bacterium]HJL89698.1 imidazole glycerol phosphate synthase subunit HisH [Acidimicrobiales bacterium]HJO98812.1 imidazole glycerol phosphate synthase subunit HisH [Acidimicrobiales bacterium]